MKRLVFAALVGAIVIVGLIRVTSGGGDYRAELSHASGLKSGDDVRVAGIPVGKVTGIRLDGDKAIVSFTVKPSVTLHRDARAAVKMATLLGKNYFEVLPGKGPALSAGGTIDVSHTTPAYTLSNVVTKANSTLQGLDMDTLDKAITTLSTELDGDPAVTSAALAGVTSLSRTVAGKDQQIGRLLTSLRQVTDTVHGQQDEIDELMTDSDTVLTMITRRRDTLRTLLANAERVAAGLATLADNNDEQLHQMLKQFKVVLTVLDRNADALDQTLRKVGPQARYFANATGNGPWIDVYAPYFLFPDNLLCPLVNQADCR